jgi:hypothetical protein
MKHDWLIGAVLLGALLACKNKEQTARAEPPPPPAATPTPAPTPAAPPEPKFPDYRGSYTSNWGGAKCTQVKKNVNCLYQGKTGSLDCKIVGDDGNELECEWDDSEGRGKAKFKRKDDGQLVGSWGHGSSATNGGPWVFKPKKE